jgi:hypothetical protein
MVLTGLLRFRWHLLAALACCLTVGVLLLLAVPPTHAQSVPLTYTTPERQPLTTSDPFRYYEETGHNLGEPFLSFYDAHGGSEVFGLPITEVITDTALDVPVQYFERARFELHRDDTAEPASAEVRTSPLGRLLTAERSDPAFAPDLSVRTLLASSLQRSRGVYASPTTGHVVRGTFGRYWQEHGGLAVFGAPISAPLVEEIDGSPRLVQYFEHARLDYFAEGDRASEAIQPAQIGHVYLAQQPQAEALLAPAPQIVRLGSATTPYYGPDSPESQNILLSARQINGLVVPPGAEMSFLDAAGPLTAAAGYVDGYGIIGNEIVPMLAGGICQTSSALYVAALHAGVEITERHNHSYLLSFFADSPGLEAAVYEGWSRDDLRWHNDTPYTITVSASLEPAARLVRVSLWGISDGRQVTLGAPARLATYEAEEVWELDEEMEEGTNEEEQSAIPGMDVAVWRQVLDAAGNVLHDDYIVTHYKPMPALFRHGPGGNPNETTTPTPSATATEAAPATPDSGEQAPQAPIEPQATPTSGQSKPLPQPTEPQLPAATPTPAAPPVPEAPPAEAPPAEAPPAEAPPAEAPPAEAPPAEAPPALPTMPPLPQLPDSQQ